MKKSTSIKVVCRFRPLNKLEIGMGGETCIDVTNNAVELNLASKNDRKYKFAFDTIFSSDTTQQQVFETVGKPVLERKILILVNTGLEVLHFIFRGHFWTNHFHEVLSYF